MRNVACFILLALGMSCNPVHKKAVASQAATRSVEDSYDCCVYTGAAFDRPLDGNLLHLRIMDPATRKWLWYTDLSMDSGEPNTAKVMPGIAWRHSAKPASSINYSLTF